MSTATPQEQILRIVNNHWQSCCVGAPRSSSSPMCSPTAPCTSTFLPSAPRRTRRAVSAAAGFGKHGDLHSNVAASIRQHAGSDCLRRNLPGSNWASIRFTLCSARRYSRGGEADAVLEERRAGFDQVTGQNGSEHMQSNPETCTIFNQAMRDLSTAISPA